MRIRDLRDDDTPEINLIPLIDVLLCLLIFFVVTTTFDARSVLKLELPRANGQPNEAQSNSLSLLINADGKRFVDEGMDFHSFTYAKYGGEVLKLGSELDAA